MATKYAVLKGFAGVGKDNVKRYFSPANAHEVGDLLDDKEIQKHVKAGNLSEYEEDKNREDIPLESAPPSEPEVSSTKKKGGK